MNSTHLILLWQQQNDLKTQNSHLQTILIDVYNKPAVNFSIDITFNEISTQQTTRQKKATNQINKKFPKKNQSFYK